MPGNFEKSKILIADDIETNIKILHRILTMQGYTNLIETTDSSSVLELVEKHQPDIILLDLMMPKISGYDILKQLRDQGSTIPVIVLTALREHDDRMKALSFGAKDFISKPFDQSELILRIENNLETSLLYKQLQVQNQYLEEKVEQRTKAITQLQYDLITHLSRTIEYRDKGTGNHVTRIGLYAKHLAKLMELPAEFCSEIEYASMLHDIGKLSIPDSILFHEGKFTQEQRLFMQNHTIAGAEIMRGSSSPILKMGERVARTHHEYWNGDGYPDGLSKEDIPVEGRITAICDVFDALSTARRYKDAWSQDDIVTEIKRLRGVQFDPNITDLFLAHLDEFISLLEENYNAKEEGDFYEGQI